MHPWMPVALACAAAVAIVAGRLWHGTKRRRPFIMREVDPAAALSALATVRDGTKIDLVAADAGELAHRERWVRVLQSWLKAGAIIRCVVMARDDEGESRLAGLPGASTGLELRRLTEEARGLDLARDCMERRFAVFSGPPQLWIESRRLGGNTMAEDCEYVPAAGHDERGAVLEDAFSQLVASSHRIDGVA